MRVFWSERALRDLREITEYIRADNPSAARRVHQQVRTATRRLARFPRLGRMVPEFGEDIIREIIVRDYRVIYGLTGEQVEIHTVVHGSRDLLSLWPFEEDEP